MAQLGFPELCKKAGVDADLGNRVIDQLKSEIEDGNTVVIRGFGSLYSEDRDAREVSTPLLKDGPVQAPAERKVKFRTSKQWRKKLVEVVA